MESYPLEAGPSIPVLKYFNLLATLLFLIRITGAKRRLGYFGAEYHNDLLAD